MCLDTTEEQKRCSSTNAQDMALTEADHLYQLPNEILLRIVGFPTLPDVDLLSLAKTCSRLNSIALSALFERRGFKDPNNDLQLFTSYESASITLSAVMLKFDLTSLAKVSCHISSHGPDRRDVTKLFQPISRFSALFNKLTSVGEVEVVLESSADYRMVFEDEELQKQWAQRVGGLMNLIIQKGCTKLGLRNQTFLSNNFTVASTTDMDYQATLSEEAKQKLLKDIRVSTIKKKRLDRTATTQRDPQDLVHISLEALKSSKVTSMNVGTALFILPPLSRWTTSFFQSSHITHLTFSSVLVPAEVWSCLLPQIGKSLSDSLIRLQFEYSGGIDPDLFFTFLSKLRSLQHLTFDTASIWPVDPPPSAPIPPITTSARVRNYLRRRWERRTNPSDGQSDLSSLTSLSYIRLVNAGVNLETLTLAKCAEYFQVQMPLLQRCSDNTFDLGSRCYPFASMRQDITTARSNLYPESSSIISRLVLPALPVNENDMATFAEWVAMFPKLKWLRLRPHPCDVPRGGITVELESKIAQAITLRNPEVNVTIHRESPTSPYAMMYL